MHDLAVFGKLSAFCVRNAWWVVAGWVGIAGVLNVAVPQLEHTAAEHSAPFTPDSPSSATLRQMSADFGVPNSTAIGGIVISGDRVLGPADAAYYQRLVERLVADQDDVAYVLDTFGNPGLDHLGMSPDGKAIHLMVATTGDVGSTRAHRSTEAVRAVIASLDRPAGLAVNFTGPSPTLSDLFSSIDTSLLIITGVSLVLITALLLLAYRSLWTALIPLLTVGISLLVSRSVISALGGRDLLSVSNFTIALATAMVLGAGTDYAIFLLANYHEGRRRDEAVDDAVARAGARTAGIVIASALTIAGAGLAMIFTKIGMFRTAGPPISLAIAITAAVSLTLTPALLALWGRRGRAEPRALDERRWRRRGARIIRRAPVLVAASLVFLIATSAALTTFRPNIDENAMQLHDTDSKLGYEATYRHWGVNEAAPEFILIRADHDLRNTRDLAALDQVAQAVGNLPQIAYVRSLTRPNGKPIPETAVGYQTRVIADGLTDAHQRLQQAVPDLRRLAAGVSQLHDGAASAADRMPQLVSGATEIVTLARTLVTNLESGDRLIATVSDGSLDVPAVLANLSNAATALQSVSDDAAASRADMTASSDALHSVFDPITSAVPSAACAADDACIKARQAFADLDSATGGRASTAINAAQVLAPVVPDDVVRNALRTLPEIRANIAGLQSLIDQLGTRSPQVARAQLSTLVAGITELSHGLERLNSGLSEAQSGTDRMVSLTEQLTGGLGQAAAFLGGMSAGTVDGAGRGFYLPPRAQDDPRFAAGRSLLISPDGRSARMMAVWAVNPYGWDAMHGVTDVLDAAKNATSGTTLEHATIETTGLASLSRQHVDQTWRDFALFGVVAVGAVLLVLIVMLRSLVAPLLMVGAVILSFASAAGVSTLIWQHAIGIDLDWSVFPVSFMALVAVGADYSMLFAARIREESGSGVINGIIRGFGSTGSVITTAGMVFAITMFALTSGTVLNLVQIGSTIGLGLLLDITIVRTYLLPAAMSLLGERMWWPSAAGHGVSTAAR